jgi:hypothetical protein
LTALWRVRDFPGAAVAVELPTPLPG